MQIRQRDNNIFYLLFNRSDMLPCTPDSLGLEDSLEAYSTTQEPASGEGHAPQLVSLQISLASTRKALLKRETKQQTFPNSSIKISGTKPDNWAFLCSHPDRGHQESFHWHQTAPISMDCHCPPPNRKPSLISNAPTQQPTN